MDLRLEIQQRMHEIAQTRIRYGYQRAHIMLKRDGWTVGRNLVWRLYHNVRCRTYLAQGLRYLSGMQRLFLRIQAACGRTEGPGGALVYNLDHARAEAVACIVDITAFDLEGGNAIHGLMWLLFQSREPT